MSQEAFNELVGRIAIALEGRALDSAMATYLNEAFGHDSDDFAALSSLCTQGEAEGWLMSRSGGGIKYGRAIKPGSDAGRFSVDVVRMQDVAGPHHIHTTGEIGAIIPISGDPKFDGMGMGWYVYPPGSDHYPTVSGGDAYVLYLLPEGAIEFTGR